MPQANEKTVLIAEDIPEVRRLLAKQIAGMGYGVETVSSGDAAYAALEKKQHFYALVTDSFMPGTLEGGELIRLAKARWPHLICLLVSGYTDPESDVELEKIHGVKVLRKPVRRKVLLSALASEL